MTDDRPLLESALREQLDRIWSRHTVKAIRQDEAGGPLDPAGRVLLRTVARRGPLRSSELADLCRMSRPSVSRRLTALYEAAFVCTDPDPQDGRAALIAISPLGAETLDRLDAEGVQAMNQVVTEFDLDELRSFTGLLGRFNDRADAVVVADTRAPAVLAPRLGIRSSSGSAERTITVITTDDNEKETV